MNAELLLLYEAEIRHLRLGQDAAVIVIGELRKSAEALVSKLEECKPGIDSAFLAAWIHGARYDGPNYKNELEHLKAVLIATGGNHEHQDREGHHQGE